MANKVTRWISNPEDLDLLNKYLSKHKLPMTVVVENGLQKKRSNDQNRLQRFWLNEAEEQGDMTAEEYRAYCKLHFGVPILRNQCDEFKEAYDSKVKHCYSYEQKLNMMMIPCDFPVTRLMTVKQHQQFLDKMYVHFSSIGIGLTVPEDLRNIASKEWLHG